MIIAIKNIYLNLHNRAKFNRSNALPPTIALNLSKSYLSRTYADMQAF